MVRSALIWLVMLSVMSTAVLTYLCIKNTRKVRLTQGSVMAIAQRRAAANELIKDLAEYSRKNPAIIPVLNQTGSPTAFGNNAAPAAPGKKSR